jgi:hypothetical protein
MTRIAARAAVLALVTAGALAPTTVAATPTTPATLAAPTGSTDEDVTRVVLKVRGCGGCSLTAHSYDPDGADGGLWSSRGAKVKAGRVIFDVPTERTTGLTVAITAPWEKRVGAVGSIVFRYAGLRPGERVTTADARSARRGSACFGGTDAERLTLRVRVHRARFEGTTGRAVAPAAYTVVTQRTVGPVERTYDGYYGTQDVIPCA